MEIILCSVLGLGVMVVVAYAEYSVQQSKSHSAARAAVRALRQATDPRRRDQH